jgi:Spy/CpxP family protein refolding chaperone
MKSSKLIAGTLAAAILTLGAVLPAAAQNAPDGPPPGGPHAWGPPHPMGPAHLFRQLNLTDTQKQSMEALVTAAKPDLKGLHGQVRANMQKLKAVTPDDPNYAAVLAEVSQSNGNLHTQIATEEGNLYAQMFALLTPDQKTQLAALQAKLAADGPKGHWRKGPGPDAPPPAN